MTLLQLRTGTTCLQLRQSILCTNARSLSRPAGQHKDQGRLRASTQEAGSDISVTSSVDDLMSEADALLGDLSSGQAVSEQKPNTVVNPLTAAPPGYEVRCDVNGCSIVRVAKEEDASGPAGPSVEASPTSGEPTDFELAEGSGWKLGYDKAPRNSDDFSALIGGPEWTIELSHKEYADFIKICGDWGDGKSEDEEATLELDSQHVWMQGRAPQKRLSQLQEAWNASMSNSKLPEAAFALRFIIKTPGQREVEGRWSPEAVMDVLRHLEKESGDDSSLRASRDAFAESYA